MVTTADTPDGKTSPYIDDSEGMRFFYVTSEEKSIYKEHANTSGGKYMLYDQPTRDSRTNLTWSATSTLVGRNATNDAWSVIGTFSLRWSMTGGNVTITAWQTISTPSSVINQINTYNTNHKLK